MPKITYVRTLANGAGVVIKNVPAVTVEWEGGSEVGFAPEVVERLEALLKAAERENPPPGAFVVLDYEAPSPEER